MYICICTIAVCRTRPTYDVHMQCSRSVLIGGMGMQAGMSLLAGNRYTGERQKKVKENK